MSRHIRSPLLCAAAIALSCSVGASAQDWRYHSDASANYSRDSGGYCDQAGCPDHFWNYPIFYGPVYYHHVWYRGPAYTRDDRYGHHWFWVNGGWHRDEWHHHRPYWARDVHFGPALDFAFYESHGFRLDGRWRDEHDREAYNGDGRDSHGDNANRDNQDGGSSYGDHPRDQQGYDQNSHDSGPPHDQYGQNGSQDGNPAYAHDHGYDQGGGDGGNGGYGPAGPNDGNGGWHHDHGQNNDNQQAGPNGPGRNGGDSQNPRGSQTTSNAPPTGQITVTSATYGAICHQPKGNVTKALQDSCNGQNKCDYVVRYQTLGDPAPGCAKDFNVEWSCSDGSGGSGSAPAEAGFGSKVTLQCSQGNHG